MYILPRVSAYMYSCVVGAGAYMCVCMRVRVRVCVRACMCVCMCACVQVFVWCMQVHAGACMPNYMHMRASESCVYACMCMHACTHVHLCVCTRCRLACVFLCVCVWDNGCYSPKRSLLPPPPPPLYTSPVTQFADWTLCATRGQRRCWSLCHSEHLPAPKCHVSLSQQLRSLRKQAATWHKWTRQLCKRGVQCSRWRPLSALCHSYDWSHLNIYLQRLLYTAGV